MQMIIVHYFFRPSAARIIIIIIVIMISLAPNPYIISLAPILTLPFCPSYLILLA
jgi:hypothetical protein